MERGKHILIWTRCFPEVQPDTLKRVTNLFMIIQVNSIKNTKIKEGFI